jgi:hypothetical protein
VCPPARPTGTFPPYPCGPFRGSTYTSVAWSLPPCTWHLSPPNCCCLPLLPLTVSLLLPCVCLCVVVSAQAVERALSRVAQVCSKPFTHFHRQHTRPCFPPNVSILHACRGLAHACVSTAITFRPPCIPMTLDCGCCTFAPVCPLSLSVPAVPVEPTSGGAHQEQRCPPAYCAGFA